MAAIREPVPDSVVIRREAREPETRSDVGVPVTVDRRGRPRHRLVTIGDSLTHGFQSGAIFNTDISFPAIIADCLGCYDTFRHPQYPGFGGIPLNIELLVRDLERRHGDDVSGWELPSALFRIRHQLAEAEHWWDSGPGSVLPPRGPINHNLGIYGWDLRDALDRNADNAYFARWQLFSQLPDGERLGRTYLYFDSSFAGLFDTYIDAFAYVIPKNMKGIWGGGSPGFPGPQPSTLFKRYIRRQGFPDEHFYSAYSGSSATEVTTALAVCKRLEAFRARTRSASPTDFAVRWADLLEHAWRPRRKPWEQRVAWGERRDHNRAIRGQAYALTIMAGIGTAQERPLREALAGMATASPFAAEPRTHFTRLVIVERLHVEGGGADAGRLSGPYLVCSCVFDTEPAAGHDPVDVYAASLCDHLPEATDAIWGACGAPRADRDYPQDLACWLRRHQLGVDAFFAPYGTATVGQVRASLARADDLAAFALRTQRDDPRRLQEAFRRQFGP